MKSLAVYVTIGILMIMIGCEGSTEPDYTDVPIITTFTLHDEDPDFPHWGVRMIKDDLYSLDELTFEGYY